MQRYLWTVMTYGITFDDILLTQENAKALGERLADLPISLRDGTPAKVVRVYLEGNEDFGSLMAEVEALPPDEWPKKTRIR